MTRLSQCATVRMPKKEISVRKIFSQKKNWKYLDTVKISDVTDIYSDPRFHDGIAPETLPVDIEIDFRAMHFRK